MILQIGALLERTFLPVGIKDDFEEMTQKTAFITFILSSYQKDGY
jgi:hypothetical protein